MAPGPLAQCLRGGRDIVEVDVYLGRRCDAELGEVVDHRGGVLRVLHQPLVAVQEVVLEGGLGVLAPLAQTIGHFGRNLLSGAFGADVTDG